jgi:hypothetical protein
MRTRARPDKVRAIVSQRALARSRRPRPHAPCASIC